MNTIFSIFGKNVNKGRLALYKRKLEDEYLAGVLRFMAVNGNKIPKKDQPNTMEVEGTEEEKPAQTETQTQPQEKGESENMWQKLEKELNDFNTELNNEDRKRIQNSITEWENDIKDIEKLIRRMELFKKSETDENLLKRMDETITTSKDDMKYITNLITAAKKLLEKFPVQQSGTTQAQQPVQETGTTNENYEMVNEAVVSKILGDPLRDKKFMDQNDKVVKEFKDLDVAYLDNAELANQFRENPEWKTEATKHVNKEAVMAIQISAEKLYKVQKEGADKQRVLAVKERHKQALEQDWKKMVDKVRGKFRYYLTVENVKGTVDPIYLAATDEYARTKDTYGDKTEITSFAKQEKNMVDATLTEKSFPKIHCKVMKQTTKQSMYIVFKDVVGNFSFGLLLLGIEEKGYKIFKYCGLIDSTNLTNKSLSKEEPLTRDEIKNFKFDYVNKKMPSDPDKKAYVDMFNTIRGYKEDKNDITFFVNKEWFGARPETTGHDLNLTLFTIKDGKLYLIKNELHKKQGEPVEFSEKVPLNTMDTGGNRNVFNFKCKPLVISEIIDKESWNFSEGHDEDARNTKIREKIDSIIKAMEGINPKKV
jgi:hypothetical protein